MSKEYEVCLPIYGHAWVNVEADSKEEAILKAMEEVRLDDIEEWEAIETVGEGNVLYLSTPWEARATEVNDE